MRQCKPLDLVHRENIFLELLTVDRDNHAFAWVPQEDFIFGRLLEHLLEPLEQSVRSFPSKPSTGAQMPLRRF